MTKEELLSWNGPRRIDDYPLSGGMGVSHEGRDVWEERRLELARLVTRLPEMSLQSFEVGSLDVSGYEVADMSL